MTDYSKLKVDELKSLLKQRSLSSTGNKADLVARLQSSDKAPVDTAADPSTTISATEAEATAPVEDEIDWDDNDDPNPDNDNAGNSAKPTTAPAEAAVAAGGKGRVSNPAKVPNQVVAVDPSTTSDLTVIPPTGSKIVASSAPVAAAKAEDASNKTPAPENGQDVAKAAAENKHDPTNAKPTPTDFSSGIPSTDLDAELAKRKARAAKFGIEESAEDALKALERAKRFGTGSKDEQMAVKGLDEALPERRTRKRGRGVDGEGDEGGDGAKGRGGKRRGRGGAGAGRPGLGRRESSRRGDGEKKESSRRGNGEKKESGGAQKWMSEKDREAAERRKGRFAAKAGA